MNMTESFSEFSSKVGPTDLMLYAGVGIVLWVLFKDKLSPVQKFLSNLVGSIATNKLPSLPSVVTTTPAVSATEDVFFDLVVSWKQTRDLAVKSGCSKAVEVADQMFPYLSPNVCSKEGEKNETK
jgi:hypothetical protein